MLQSQIFNVYMSFNFVLENETVKNSEFAVLL